MGMPVVCNYLTLERIIEMKKITTRVFCMILAFAAAATMVSCNSVSFTPGEIKENVYTSEFSSITFEKPSSWRFLSDEEIGKLVNQAEKYVGSEELEKAAQGSVIECYAMNELTNDNVVIEIAKGGYITSLDKSITASIKLIKESYESINWSCTSKDPVEVKLGKETYKMVEINVDLGDTVSLTQYCYFRLVGNYLVSITCTKSVAGEFDRSQFEALFK